MFGQGRRESVKLREVFQMNEPIVGDVATDSQAPQIRERLQRRQALACHC